MRAREFIENVSSDDLSLLHGYLHSIFSPYGVEVTFDRHFTDRVNDLRNRSDDFPEGITFDHLKKLFFLIAKRHGSSIYGMAKGTEAVLRDKTIGINIPFTVTSTDGHITKIFLKTAIRTEQFRTSNRVFRIQHNNQPNI